ncbi:hypothetical protein [Vampirovibrio sp.]|uniref:hypothetical protein n=1 Tax=Vampirovibrio sp. TaxID=2717857 RepID=UPI00359412E9
MVGIHLSGSPVWPARKSRESACLEQDTQYASDKVAEKLERDWPHTAPLPLELPSPSPDQSGWKHQVKDTLKNLSASLKPYYPHWDSSPQKEKSTQTAFFPALSPTLNNAEDIRLSDPAAPLPQKAQASQPRNIALPHTPDWQKSISFLDSERNQHTFNQFGNLSPHGAFWLENTKGETMGLLRKSRLSQTLGDKLPKSFYRIELDLSDAIADSPVGGPIQNHLIKEATRQARLHDIRIMVKPENEALKNLYQDHGFTTLSKALNNGMPYGAINPTHQNVKGWMAFDGNFKALRSHFF